MNKTFIKKIMQAKKLQYGAIKEIVPEKMKIRIDLFEKEAFDLIKDITIEMIKEDIEEKSKAACKRIKKVSVDFN